MANNVAEFILKIAVDGKGQAQQFAAELVAVDKAAAGAAQQLRTISTAQEAAVQRTAAVGAQVTSTSTGLRGMRSAILLVDGALQNGLSPANVLQLARSFVFLQSTLLGVRAALSGGALLAITGVLAAVGFAFRRQQQDAEETKKKAEEYAKAIDLAQQANRALNDALRAGQPLAQRQLEKVQETARAAIEQAKGQLTEAERLLGRLEDSRLPPNVRQEQIKTAQAAVARLKTEIADAESAIARARVTPAAEEATFRQALLALRTANLREEIELDKLAADARRTVRADAVAAGEQTELAARREALTEQEELYQRHLVKLREIQTLVDAELQSIPEGPGRAKLTETLLAVEREIRLTDEARFNARLKSEAEITALTQRHAATRAQESADFEIRMAEATGDKLKATWLKTQQEIAAIMVARHPELNPEVAAKLPPPIDVQEYAQVIKVTAEFNDLVQRTGRTLAQYREEQARLDRELQAHPERADQIAAKETELRAEFAKTALTIREDTLPTLRLYLEILQKLGVDTRALEETLAALADGVHSVTAGSATTADRWAAGFAGLQLQWASFGDAVKAFADTTLDSLNQTFANTITNMLTGTGNVRQEWQNLGKTMISTLARMLSEYVSTKLAMMAVDLYTGKTRTAAAAGQAPTNAMSGVFQAGAEGGWVGVIIYIAAVMAAMAAMYAIIGAASGGFAVGGVVEGPGTETSDSIPALLSKNEYVVTAQGHRAAGTERMDRVNRGESFFFPDEIPQRRAGGGGFDSMFRDNSAWYNILFDVMAGGPYHLQTASALNAGTELMMDETTSDLDRPQPGTKPFRYARGGKVTGATLGEMAQAQATRDRVARTYSQRTVALPDLASVRAVAASAAVARPAPASGDVAVSVRAPNSYLVIGQKEAEQLFASDAARKSFVHYLRTSGEEIETARAAHKGYRDE